MSASLSHMNYPFSDITFSIEDNHTFVIGIDVDEQRFYVYYNNNFAYYDYISTGRCQDLAAVVWGGNDPTTNDDVSVNFGDEPFKYKIVDSITQIVILFLLS